jgi:hypothetical protein
MHCCILLDFSVRIMLEYSVYRIVHLLVLKEFVKSYLSLQNGALSISLCGVEIVVNVKLLKM